LDRGDLPDAVMEVRGVSGAAAAPLGAWLETAEARIGVDRAAADLNARIVQTLAAPPSEVPLQSRQTDRPPNAARRR
jgi:hypothetical protein